MSKRMSLEAFIEKVKASHPNENLDFSEVVYVNNRTDVIIIDRDLDENGNEYGAFKATPNNLFKGQSHPRKRGNKISRSKSLTTEEVVERFKQVHKGEKLDYSKVEYVNMHTPVCIICRELDANGNEYGEFWQPPSSHLKGSTHKQLAIDRNAERNRYDNETFIEKCKAVHKDDDYDYSLVDYKASQIDVSIICNKIGSNGKPHGVFKMNPDALLQGKGCPKCGKHLSYAELEIYEMLCNKLGEDKVILHDKSLLDGLEVDIYIPSLNVGIEYNGLRWHSEWFGGKGKRYHINKTVLANSKGVGLILIFEDEYVQHKDIIFDKICHSLGIDDGSKPKVGGRKCKIKDIDKKTAEAFLNTSHIQGFANSTIHIGAYYENILIGVMSFTKNGEEWNLVRFATDSRYICQGIGGKLFSYFIENYNPTIVKSFADRRWTLNPSDNLYTHLGFELESITEPDYTYYKTGECKRYHKFLFRKQILHKKYGLPLAMTETEMTRELGYDRVWNCGLFKYVWKKKD